MYSDVASASASGGVEKDQPGTTKNYAAGSMSVSFTSEEADKGMGCDAAIRIVHVGDCMGMLVRDEDIVWRTEEMWWNVRSFSLTCSLLSLSLLSSLCLYFLSPFPFVLFLPALLIPASPC